MSAKQAKRRKGLKPSSVIVALLCAALLLYFGYLYVSTIRQNNANKARLAELESVNASMSVENSILQEQQKNANEEQIMEDRARERGYIDPNERVYEDITPTE